MRNQWITHFNDKREAPKVETILKKQKHLELPKYLFQELRRESVQSRNGVNILHYESLPNFGREYKVVIGG